jgi:hypothetical protein
VKKHTISTEENNTRMPIINKIWQKAGINIVKCESVLKL